jgi:hypothetical protein
LTLSPASEDLPCSAHEFPHLRASTSMLTPEEDMVVAGTDDADL